MIHDPLCPSADGSADIYCECELIAKVREDTNASQLTMWNRTQEQAAFIIETATKSVWIDGYGEGRKDMLAKCIAAVDARIRPTLHPLENAGIGEALAALRALQEKP